METIKTNPSTQCHWCGRYEDNIAELTENFICPACDTRIENPHYVGHGLKVEGATTQIINEVAKIPEETLRLLKAEKRRGLKVYILKRVIISIIAGIILHFIIRFFIG